MCLQPNCPVPYGECHCGCGEQAPIATMTRTKRGHKMGEPLRFIHGHRARLQGRTGPGPNPSGLCRCGCKGRTPLAEKSSAAQGWVIGQPKRYIAGHHRYKSLVEYIEQDCGYETPCWVWQRSLNNVGYGRAYLPRKGGRRRNFLAHRLYYERHVGPIPEGLTLDHLCCNKVCVNPDHLEPVTRAENIRRAWEVKRAVA